MKHIVAIVFAILIVDCTALGQSYPEGFWDDAFSPADIGGNGLTSQAFAVAKHPTTGETFVGGEFNLGEGRNEIVRWDGSSWVGVGMGVSSTVYSLEFGPDGTLYVGGSFTTATQSDGTVLEALRIAAWDGTEWSALGKGASATVRDVEYDELNDRVYIGGSFESVTNADESVVLSSAIAFWGNSEWNAVGQGADDVRAVGVDPINGDVIIGGQFLDEGYNEDGTVISASGLARWDGSSWNAFGNPDGFANVIRYDESGDLYVGGDFEEIGGIDVTNIARYSNAAWQTVTAGTSGPFGQAVNDILIGDDGIYAVGRFTEVLQSDGTLDSIQRISYLDLGSGEWWPMGPARHADSFINAVAGDDDELWFVGAFTDIGGRLAHRVNRWFRTSRPFQTTVSTFAVDLRSARRHGVFNFQSNILLDVTTGDAAGLFVLEDADGDTVYTVISEQPSNTTIGYSFLIDESGNADGVDLDWYRELDFPSIVREINIPSTGPFSVPQNVFDDQNPEGPLSGYTSDDIQALYPTLTGRRIFDNGVIANRIWFELDFIDRPTSWSVHEYQENAGGILPDGIPVASDHAVWRMETWPSAAVYSLTLEWEYQNITGIRDPNDLRMLFREDSQSPWVIIPTEVVASDRLLRVPNVTDISGEWTVGSASEDNPLTIFQPAIAMNPVPGDGGLNIPTTTTLRWDAQDVAEHELYLWLEGEEKPVSPLATPIDSEFHVTTLSPDSWYNWTVTGTNIHGEIEGPVWTFRAGTAPDLTVSAVSIPEEIFSGQSIEISWTVENIGQGGTNVAGWTDNVYLSNDTSLEPDSDVLLATARNFSYLNPGDSYTNAANVHIPDGIQGPRYIILRTDNGSIVNEEDEDNNTVTELKSITLTPFADLEVTDIIAPAVVFSGDSIDVTWTVSNNGSGVTSTEHWYDTILISSDDSLDFNFTNDDTVIRINETAVDSSAHDGELQPGADYQMTKRVKLPADVVDDAFLFVYADINGAGKQPTIGNVYEFNQELDNWKSIPLDITLTPPPDLVVTGVNPPPSGVSGDGVTVSWTVTNEGPGSTVSETWADLLYLSPTAEFDSSTSILLGSFRQLGAIVNDSTYTQTVTAQIPDGVSGDLYYIIATDWRDDVFEHEFNDNNLSASATTSTIELAPYPDLSVSSVSSAVQSVTAGSSVRISYEVTNTGSADTDVARTDSLFISPADTWDRSVAIPLNDVVDSEVLVQGSAITKNVAVIPPATVEGEYYFHVVTNATAAIFELPGSATNIGTSGPVNIDAYPPIDLAVSSIQAPASAASGQRVSVSLSVRNDGSGATLSNGWTDRIYLSGDQVFQDERDILLGEVIHGQKQPGNSTYSINPDLMIPHGISGEYNILVVVDADSLEWDSNLSNNMASVPVSIELTSPSDLVVSSISAPADAVAGQPISVIWTVENLAIGETEKNLWYDAVYISSDRTVDSSDKLLGTRVRNTGLGSAASYTDTLRTTVPTFVAGSNYILVQTDTRNDLYEHLAESNNIATSLTDFDLPEPSDLVIEDVAGPATAIPGESALITWTLRNQGTNAARGIVRDAVYISADEQWSADDKILGVHEREIDLAPGATGNLSMRIDVASSFALNAAGDVTAKLPGVPSGDYFFIVRADIVNQLREDDEDNNAASSTAQTSVDLPILELAIPTQLSLSEGETRFFELQLPAGQDVLVNVTGEASGLDAIELYVSKDEVPDPSSSDFSSSIPFETDQEIVVSTEDSGTYYVLVAAQSSGTDDIDVELSAEVLDFAVRSVHTTAVGTGPVTLIIDGSNFSDETEIVFRGSNGDVLSTTTNIGDRTVLAAQVDFSDAQPGDYDILAVESGAESGPLTNRFQVSGSPIEDVEVIIESPERVRSSETIDLSVTVRNNGNTSLLDYFINIDAIVEPTAFCGARPIPEEGSLSRMFTLFPPASLAGLGNTQFVEYEPGIYGLPIWLIDMPPSTKITFQVSVEHTMINCYTIKMATQMIRMPGSLFTETGNIADISSSEGFQLISSAIAGAFRDVAGLATSTAPEQAITTANERVPGDDYQDEYDILIDRGVTDYTDNLDNFADPTNVLLGVLAGAVAGGVIGAFGGPVGITGGIVIGAAEGAALAKMYDTWANPFGIVSPFQDFVGSKHCRVARETPELAGSAEACQAAVDRTETDVVSGLDPNDIIGPDGFGDANWISVADQLPYRVRFENDAQKASAPAQVVTIRQQLDPELDIRTFRLGKFGFANLEFLPPPNKSFYRATLDATSTLGLQVDFAAGIDVTTGEAFWSFRSIDPMTGQAPADPLAGFLPVNDSTGVGEGFVTYTIVPTETSATGDKIDAEASIIFDINAPLDTPPIFNTIDANSPTSATSVTRSDVDPESFQLYLSGNDVGVGLGTYNLYSSKDDGPFELVEVGITDSTYLFTVDEPGSTYRVYTVATDYVGNSEAGKSSDSAIVVAIEEDTQSIPTEFALHPNYPNPFNGKTNIPYDLPEVGDIDLEVYDLLGRRVAKITRKGVSAGRHTQELDMSRYASGLYLYRLAVSGSSDKKYQDSGKLVLVK
ncbi:MAG: T9SS type A sorting domain-containing protein [Rhodothermales bacterium]|nr:T9SS type A sorting domain-containing protein [Rhodothermales bacterium]